MPTVEEYLEIIVKGEEHGRNPYDDQRLLARTLYDSLSIPGTVQVGQGPTGMGKTAVEIAVARKLADEGKRVLLASPSYEHVDANLAGEARHVFPDPIPVWKGISRYEEKVKQCPLGKAGCTNQIAKVCEDPTCEIARDRRTCLSTLVVFTVHHVLASTPSIINLFNAVIIDESHGFPNVLASQSHKTLDVQDLVRGGLISGTDKGMLDKYTREGRKPPQALVDKIWKNIKQASSSAGGESDKDLKYMVKAELTSDGKLYSSRPAPPYKHNGKVSIGLISATIEDPHDHVNDCKFGELNVRGVCKIDSEYFRKRFERRPVYGLLDGPTLGKGDPANYPTFRQAANEIIADLISSIDEITLILCQNNTDAQSVYSHLKTVKLAADRVTVLPDELLDDELSTYQHYIKNEIERGRKVIIATASSKLWEGANIDGLHLLIIDSLPYRPQTPEERRAEGRKAQYAWRSQKRFMLNRVQQGIGRLVRADKEWGICVIVDGRFYHGRKQFTRIDAMPRFITDYITYMTAKDAESTIPVVARKLALNPDSNVRVNQRLDDFLKRDGTS